MKEMIKGALLLHSALLLVLAGTVQAAETYVYATYMTCDLTQQDRVDDIFNTLDKAFYDQAVSDGGLSAYSYYAHQTGGQWRRGMFTVAPTIKALLDSQKKVGDQIEAKNQKLSAEATRICNTHVDYIWRSVAGNVSTAPPGKAAFSTYLVCDSREAQADAIVTQVFAPIYDQMVADGKLLSWGYLEHIVGGHFRRLATMTATDMTALLTARAELNEIMFANPLSNTFTEICDSHDDYMWDVIANSSP